MKLSSALLITSGLLLNGCANETPLVFVSKTSVGLDVSSPTTGTTDVGISFGWKSIDAAYIPVVEIAASGKVVTQIKSGESITPEQRNQLTTYLAGQLTTATANLQTQQAGLDNAANKVTAQANIEEQKKYVQTLSDSLARVLDRNDALSVFSVVDTNSQIRKETTGIGVGKVYATGLAAQHVARNYNSNRTCAQSISAAVVKLAESKVAADQEKAKALIAACNVTPE